MNLRWAAVLVLSLVVSLETAAERELLKAVDSGSVARLQVAKLFPQVISNDGNVTVQAELQGPSCPLPTSRVVLLLVGAALSGDDVSILGVPSASDGCTITFRTISYLGFLASGSYPVRLLLGSSQREVPFAAAGDDSNTTRGDLSASKPVYITIVAAPWGRLTGQSTTSSTSTSSVVVLAADLSGFSTLPSTMGLRLSDPTAATVTPTMLTWRPGEAGSKYFTLRLRRWVSTPLLAEAVSMNNLILDDLAPTQVAVVPALPFFRVRANHAAYRPFLAMPSAPSDGSLTGGALSETRAGGGSGGGDGRPGLGKTGGSPGSMALLSNADGSSRVGLVSSVAVAVLRLSASPFASALKFQAVVLEQSGCSNVAACAAAVTGEGRLDFPAGVDIATAMVAVDWEALPLGAVLRVGLQLTAVVNANVAEVLDTTTALFVYGTMFGTCPSGTTGPWRLPVPPSGEATARDDSAGAPGPSGPVGNSTGAPAPSPSPSVAPAPSSPRVPEACSEVALLFALASYSPTAAMLPVLAVCTIGSPAAVVTPLGPAGPPNTTASLSNSSPRSPLPAILPPPAQPPPAAPEAALLPLELQVPFGYKLAAIFVPLQSVAETVVVLNSSCVSVPLWQTMLPLVDENDGGPNNRWAGGHGSDGGGGGGSDGGGPPLGNATSPPPLSTSTSRSPPANVSQAPTVAAWARWVLPPQVGPCTAVLAVYKAVVSDPANSPQRQQRRQQRRQQQQAVTATYDTGTTTQLSATSRASPNSPGTSPASGNGNGSLLPPAPVPTTPSPQDPSPALPAPAPLPPAAPNASSPPPRGPSPPLVDNGATGGSGGVNNRSPAVIVNLVQVRAFNLTLLPRSDPEIFTGGSLALALRHRPTGLYLPLCGLPQALLYAASRRRFGPAFTATNATQLSWAGTTLSQAIHGNPVAVQDLQRSDESGSAADSRGGEAGGRRLLRALEGLHQWVSDHSPRLAGGRPGSGGGAAGEERAGKGAAAAAQGRRASGRAGQAGRDGASSGGAVGRATRDPKLRRGPQRAGQGARDGRGLLQTGNGDGGRAGANSSVSPSQSPSALASKPPLKPSPLPSRSPSNSPFPGRANATSPNPSPAAGGSASSGGGGAPGIFDVLDDRGAVLPVIFNRQFVEWCSLSDPQVVDLALLPGAADLSLEATAGATVLALATPAGVVIGAATRAALEEQRQAAAAAAAASSPTLVLSWGQADGSTSAKSVLAPRTTTTTSSSSLGKAAPVLPVSPSPAPRRKLLAGGGAGEGDSRSPSPSPSQPRPSAPVPSPASTVNGTPGQSPRPSATPSSRPIPSPKPSPSVRAPSPSPSPVSDGGPPPPVDCITKLSELLVPDQRLSVTLVAPDGIATATFALQLFLDYSAAVAAAVVAAAQCKNATSVPDGSWSGGNGTVVAPAAADIMISSYWPIASPTMRTAAQDLLLTLPLPLSPLAACQVCGAGRFSSGANATACAQCGPGTFSNETYNAECVLCPAGHYTFQSNSTACRPCIAGSFAPRPGSSSCSVCPTGTTSLADGSRDCVAPPPPPSPNDGSQYALVVSFSMLLNMPEPGSGAALDASKTGINASPDTAMKMLIAADMADALRIPLSQVCVILSEVSPSAYLVNVSATMPLGQMSGGGAAGEAGGAASGGPGSPPLGADDLINRLVENPDESFPRTKEATGGSLQVQDVQRQVVTLTHGSKRINVHVVLWPTLAGTAVLAIIVGFACSRYCRRRRTARQGVSLPPLTDTLGRLCSWKAPTSPQPSYLVYGTVTSLELLDLPPSASSAPRHRGRGLHKLAHLGAAGRSPVGGEADRAEALPSSSHASDMDMLSMMYTRDAMAGPRI